MTYTKQTVTVSNEDSRATRQSRDRAPRNKRNELAALVLGAAVLAGSMINEVKPDSTSNKRETSVSSLSDSQLESLAKKGKPANVALVLMPGTKLRTDDSVARLQTTGQQTDNNVAKRIETPTVITNPIELENGYNVVVDGALLYVSKAAKNQTTTDGQRYLQEFTPLHQSIDEAKAITDGILVKTDDSILATNGTTNVVLSEVHEFEAASDLDQFLANY